MLPTPIRTVVLLGKENVGKTQLAALIVRPRPLVLERSALGPFWALLLLLTPAWVAVDAANRLADRIEPWVGALTGPLAGLLTSWPQPLAEILAGDYGFVTMGPLLLVWATPVVVLHTLLMGAYKASGLLDRLTNAMNPWLQPFGMTGRELARVVMGFGCNVPAVISARSSSACSRGVCVSAIAFGSACSYQLGATLAVFAAAGRPDLVVPYLLYLGATTLAYARLIAPQAARSPFNVLLTEGRVFLTWPRPRAIWLEAQGVVREFLRRALPVFFLITAAASLLHWLGALQAASAVVEPAMAIFRLALGGGPGGGPGERAQGRHPAARGAGRRRKPQRRPTVDGRLPGRRAAALPGHLLDDCARAGPRVRAAVGGPAGFSIAELLVDQVELANVLVLNKTDKMSGREVARLIGILRKLNRTATLAQATYGRIPLDLIFDTGLFDFERIEQTAGWFQELQGGHTPRDRGVRHRQLRLSEATALPSGAAGGDPRRLLRGRAAGEGGRLAGHPP